MFGFTKTHENDNYQGHHVAHGHHHDRRGTHRHASHVRLNGRALQPDSLTQRISDDHGTTEPIQAISATCPLCENNCPLSEPSCGQGKSYARTLQAAANRKQGEYAMADQPDTSETTNHDELTMLFRHASKLMARAAHHCAHTDHAQQHVYSVIRERGPMAQSDLLEILDVRSSSLSEVLGKLERSGQIVRTRNENDKRSFIISVNEENKTTPENLQQAHEDSSRYLFACLEDEERAQLGGLLKKIISSLEQNDMIQAGPRGRGLHGHGRRGAGLGRCQGLQGMKERRGRTVGRHPKA